MQTDLSLSLGVVHEPSKVTGCRAELPKKTGLFMTSSERAANVPPLATEDRVCHRFTCQLPGERQRQRERLLSSIALPITCHPSAHVDQYRPVGGGLQGKRDHSMCLYGRHHVSDRLGHDRTAKETRQRNSAFQGMLQGWN